MPPAFLTIRSLLYKSGAPAGEIAPSTRLAPYARRFADVFLGPLSPSHRERIRFIDLLKGKKPNRESVLEPSTPRWNPRVRRNPTSLPSVSRQDRR